MPDDMLNFHKMMADLEASEEAMVENHKTMIDYMKQAIEKSQQLYMRANTVDYDTDGEFCTNHNKEHYALSLDE